MHEHAVELETIDGVRLEGRLATGNGSHGAVLCHPHPLYGGSMDNNVVLAVRDSLAGLSMSTLRFNFRGVGQSGGSFDGGRGEQRDIAAAFELLSQHVETVHLVAYSYGAWVALHTLSSGTTQPRSVVLISPPVDFDETDFADLTIPTVPTLIVSGDQDQFGSPDALDRWIASQDQGEEVTLSVLSGVDHFYWGGEPALRAAIERFFSSETIQR